MAARRRLSGVNTARARAVRAAWWRWLGSAGGAVSAARCRRRAGGGGVSAVGCRWRGTGGAEFGAQKIRLPCTVAGNFLCPRNIGGNFFSLKPAA